MIHFEVTPEEFHALKLAVAYWVERDKEVPRWPLDPEYDKVTTTLWCLHRDFERYPQLSRNQI